MVFVNFKCWLIKSLHLSCTETTNAINYLISKPATPLSIDHIVFKSTLVPLAISNMVENSLGE